MILPTTFMPMIHNSYVRIANVENNKDRKMFEVGHQDLDGQEKAQTE